MEHKLRFKSVKDSQQHHIDNYKSDGVLNNYGNPYQSHYHRVEYFIDQIDPNTKVLDVGCNGGSLGIHLLDKGCHVNGIDIVQSLVDKAKRRGIYAEQGEAEDLSRYDDNSFDYVLCGEVLEHLYDPIIAVKEAYRVLKPGGSYIVSVPHPYSFMCGDNLGDHHHQNFDLEMLTTIVYSAFKQGSATVVEIPYVEPYNIANGIDPIGKNKEGLNVYPPQWLGITAIKENDK